MVMARREDSCERKPQNLARCMMMRCDTLPVEINARIAPVRSCYGKRLVVQKLLYLARLLIPISLVISGPITDYVALARSL